VQTNEKPDSSTISREWAQNGTYESARSIVALDFDHVRPIQAAQALDLFVRRSAKSFLNRAIRAALPHEQVRNLSRIVQHPGHSFCREEWNLFAVHSAPEESAVTPISLLHHLIPLIIVSSKIPVTGRVRKESVKVCTPESPPSTDNAPFDFSALNVFAHRAGIQSQHFRCFA